jgi:hypothetical protein
MNSILKVFIFVTSVFSAPADMSRNSIGTQDSHAVIESIPRNIINFTQRIQEIDDS